MTAQPKVSARVSGGRIMVEMTNGSRSPSDRRSEAPRFEYIEPQEAIGLIRQLASALERAGK